MKIKHKNTDRVLLDIPSLIGADLSKMDLVDANLRARNLQGANLVGTNLKGALLTDANLCEASLQGANLSHAELSFSHLESANLSMVNLYKAKLNNANLCLADLRDANLYRAVLSGANIEGAKLPAFSIVPETGAFHAWKRVRGSHVLEIEIPADAARCSTPMSRKCRAECAKPLKAYYLDKTESDHKSFRSGTVIPSYNAQYKIGEVTYADDFNPDIREVFTNGIHFYMTFEEAANA